MVTTFRSFKKVIHLKNIFQIQKRLKSQISFLLLRNNTYDQHFSHSCERSIWQAHFQPQERRYEKNISWVQIRCTVQALSITSIEMLMTRTFLNHKRAFSFSKHFPQPYKERMLQALCLISGETGIEVTFLSIIRKANDKQFFSLVRNLNELQEILYLSCKKDIHDKHFLLVSREANMKMAFSFSRKMHMTAASLSLKRDAYGKECFLSQEIYIMIMFLYHICYNKHPDYYFTIKV